MNAKAIIKLTIVWAVLISAQMGGAAHADDYAVTFLKGRSDDDGAMRRARVEATLTPENGIIKMVRAGEDQGLYHQWATFLLDIEVRGEDGDALEAVYKPHGVWNLPGWRKGEVNVTYTMALQHDRFPNLPGDNELADATPFGVMWTGRALLIEGAPSDEVTISFQAPEGWRVTSPWRPADDTGLKFTPNDTDDLLDSAFFAGTHVETIVDVVGIKARLATGPEMDAEKEVFIKTLNTYLGAYADLLNAPSVESPLVIAIRGSFWGGGVMGRTISLTHGGEMNEQIAPMVTYIVAHEAFHLWNTQWRYNMATRPEIEWVAEGIAEYYTKLIGARTGDISSDQLVAEIAQRWASYRNALSGHSIAKAGETKLEDSQSYDLVYSGGMMMSLGLDLLIREETGNRKSLDDALRMIHARYAAPTRRKLSKATLIRTIRSETGVDVSSYFEKYLVESNALPIIKQLEYVGLCLSEENSENEWSANIAPCANISESQMLAFNDWVQHTASISVYTE